MAWTRLSNNSVNSLALIKERLSLLGRKAGPVLFQSGLRRLCLFR